MLNLKQLQTGMKCGPDIGIVISISINNSTIGNTKFMGINRIQFFCYSNYIIR